MLESTSVFPVDGFQSLFCIPTDIFLNICSTVGFLTRRGLGSERDIRLWKRR